MPDRRRHPRHNNEKRSSIPPVPDPPEALVSLLQRDADVLRYFQSLQQHLQADVQKWKQRAAKAEQSNKNGSSTKESRRRGATKNKKKNSKEDDNNRDGDDNAAVKVSVAADHKKKAKTTPLSKNINKATTKAANNSDPTESSLARNNQQRSSSAAGSSKNPIKFTLESSSSEDESDSNNEAAPEQRPAKRLKKFTLMESSSDDDDDEFDDDMFANDFEQEESNEAVLDKDEFRQNTIRLLLHAHECLTSLGIDMVAVEKDDDILSGEEEEDSGHGKSGGINRNNTGNTKQDTDANQKSSPVHAAAVATDANGVEVLPINDSTSFLSTKEVFVSPQPDEDVVAQIMHVIMEAVARDGADYNSAGVTVGGGTGFEKDDDGEGGDNVTVPHNKGISKDGCGGTETSGEGRVTAESAADAAGEAGSQFSNSLRPSYVVKMLVLKTLIVLDAIASPDIPMAKWIGLLQQPLISNTATASTEISTTCTGRINKSIAIGLWRRQSMVRQWIAALDEKISEGWAVTDRTTRLSATRLHYNNNNNSSNCDEDSEKLQATVVAGSISSKHTAYLYERCVLVQVTLSLHLSRCDDISTHAASLFWKYLMSSLPVVSIEDYPKLPPTLSLVLVEAFFTPFVKGQRQQHFDASWWSETVAAHSEGDSAFLWFVSPLIKDGAVSANTMTEATSNEESQYSMIRSVLLLVVELAASIWKQRARCLDERIRDIALVEYEASRRLVSQLKEVGDDNNIVSLLQGHEQSSVLECVQHIRSEHVTILAAGCPLSNIALGILALLSGDTSSNVPCRGVETSLTHDMESWTYAQRQLEVRRVDKQRRLVGTYVGDHRAVARHSFASVKDVGAESRSTETLLSLMKCAVELGDGEQVYTLAMLLFDQEDPDSVVCDALKEASERPTVRVINLQRRPDRWNAFTSSCVRERLSYMRALVDLNHQNSGNSLEKFGRYAFDGGGRLAEAQKRLASAVGGQKQIAQLVTKEWRPGTLKPFDREAPNDDGLVFASPSERACALSHISAWRGIINSLKLEPVNTNSTDMLSVGIRERTLTRMRRVFLVSGFAQGAPFLHENCNMPPAPVCIVLEDDAVLCDDFSDRLRGILEELPRDFHFLSLGFARPKTAPIVPYRSKIGMPTGIWYLTGYVLSLAGAEYLEGQLPVEGPVDSWISLMILRNWDNMYGEAMGVGKHSRPNVVAPPHIDLIRIFKFRAYCAISPLCCQRVASASTTNVGRSWRNRDTDITYSGSDERRA